MSSLRKQLIIFMICTLGVCIAAISYTLHLNSSDMDLKPLDSKEVLDSPETDYKTYDFNVYYKNAAIRPSKRNSKTDTSLIGASLKEINKLPDLRANDVKVVPFKYGNRSYWSIVSSRNRKLTIIKPQSNSSALSKIISARNREFSQNIFFLNLKWILSLLAVSFGTLFFSIYLLESFTKKLKLLTAHIFSLSNGAFNHRVPAKENTEFGAATVLLNTFAKNLESYHEQLSKQSRISKVQDFAKSYIQRKSLNERRYLNEFILTPSINEDSLMIWGLKWINNDNYIMWFFEPTNENIADQQLSADIAETFEATLDSQNPRNGFQIRPAIQNSLKTVYNQHFENIEQNLAGFSVLHLDFDQEVISCLNFLTPMFFVVKGKVKVSKSNYNIFEQSERIEFDTVKMPILDKIVVASSALFKQKETAVICQKTTLNFIKKSQSSSEKSDSQSASQISTIQVSRQVDEIDQYVHNVG